MSHPDVVRLLMSAGDLPDMSLENLLARPAWHARAACRGVGADKFILNKGGDPRPGLALCERCHVRRECLEYAMAGEGDEAVVGTWGGTTTQGRRRMKSEAS